MVKVLQSLRVMDVSDQSHGEADGACEQGQKDFEDSCFGDWAWVALDISGIRSLGVVFEGDGEQKGERFMLSDKFELPTCNGWKPLNLETIHVE